MKKIAVLVESGDSTETCFIHLPDSLMDNTVNEPMIRATLVKALGKLGLEVLSVQRVVECGVELRHLTPLGEVPDPCKGTLGIAA